MIITTGSHVVPGVRSASEMVQHVLGHIQGVQSNPDLHDAALRGLNRGIDDVNARNWRNLKGEQTIYIADGDDQYPVVETHRRPFSLYQYDLEGRRHGRYSFLDPENMLREWPRTDTQHTPCVYTVTTNRFLQLNFPPSIEHVNRYPTLVHSFYRRLAHLASFDSVLDAPQEFASLIELYAIAEMKKMRKPREAPEAERAYLNRREEMLVDDNEIYTDSELANS